MVTGDAQTERHTLWKALALLWGTLLCASVLIYWDAVQTASYSSSLFVCPVWFVVSVVKAQVQRPGIWIAVPRVLLPLVTLALVITNYFLRWYPHPMFIRKVYGFEYGTWQTLD